MNRDSFFFQHSSRLYRQSEDLASYLLASLDANDPPFLEVFSLIEKMGAVYIGTEEAAQRAADLAWQHAIGLGAALDVRAVVPGLLETMEQYYYGEGARKAEHPWLGTALKSASVIVWKNRGSVHANVKAHEQVYRLVRAVGAWEQLQLHRDQIRALGIGTGTLTPRGVVLQRKRDRVRRAEWNSYAEKRGMALRTLKNSSDVIWRDGLQFLHAVGEVLHGELPSRIQLFQGTVFGEIGREPRFWLGLAVRLQLMAFAGNFRGRGRDNATRGISLFEPFAIQTKFVGADQQLATEVTQSAFWQPVWHADRLRRRDWLSSMPVERPAIRIDDRSFVVAITNVGDSINSFVENSVLRVFGYAGQPVAEETFRLHVSRPFENRAIACFADRGWLADHVSDRGVWLDKVLEHEDAAPMPGEIDVFAVHPNGDLAVLAECKILSAPYTASKLLNVAQKLGKVDSESFHRKLEQKAEWLRGVEAFKNMHILRMLLVDAGSFLAKGAPNLVLDIDDLPRFFAWCNGDSIDDA